MNSVFVDVPSGSSLWPCSLLRSSELLPFRNTGCSRLQYLPSFNSNSVRLIHPLVCWVCCIASLCIPTCFKGGYTGKGLFQMDKSTWHAWTNFQQKTILSNTPYRSTRQLTVHQTQNSKWKDFFNRRKKLICALVYLLPVGKGCETYPVTASFLCSQNQHSYAVQWKVLYTMQEIKLHKERT